MSDKALEELEQARIDVLTPTWIKELNPLIQQMTVTQLAKMFGVTLGLLDYARHHLTEEEWEYIQTSLLRAITG
jgi:hypothetical protein